MCAQSSTLPGDEGALRAFCTLFDRNYLLKGVALHSSLMRHAPRFVLWVLCMDETTHDVLSELALPNVQLLRLSQVEDASLAEARKDRTAAEYCWTCTPSLCAYLLREVPDIDSITYLDADLFFFANPDPLYRELAGASIGIIEHRYARELEDRADARGRYNVEFMVFQNDRSGRTCLEWWRSRCNEWCFDRVENGKFGDQKYLDDWPTRFRGVAVIQNPGAGLAPWNIARYEVRGRADKVTVDGHPLVFYHFHQYLITRAGRGYSAAGPTYSIGRAARDAVYPSYAEAIARALGMVRAVRPGFSHGVTDWAIVHRVSQALRHRVEAARVAVARDAGNRE